jgi:hypothetical protein
MTLLYRLAEWHSFSKLRMHVETTLTEMDSTTTTLGTLLRQFQSLTCQAFTTRELPKETAARGRRQARAQAKKASQPASGILPPTAKATTAAMKSKTKKLNLSTYKIHALGDYVTTIRLFGTTDSYSTQTVGCFIRY